MDPSDTTWKKTHSRALVGVDESWFPCPDSMHHPRWVLKYSRFLGFTEFLTCIYLPVVRCYPCPFLHHVLFFSLHLWLDPHTPVASGFADRHRRSAPPKRCSRHVSISLALKRAYHMSPSQTRPVWNWHFYILGWSISGVNVGKYASPMG